jgi:hypothetical protein
MKRFFIILSLLALVSCRKGQVTRENMPCTDEQIYNAGFADDEDFESWP